MFVCGSLRPIYVIVKEIWCCLYKKEMKLIHDCKTNITIYCWNKTLASVSLMKLHTSWMYASDLKKMSGDQITWSGLHWLEPMTKPATYDLLDLAPQLLA